MTASAQSHSDPQGSESGSGGAAPDFEHSRSAVIATELTPVSFYKEIAALLPPGATALFVLRDQICRRLGLEPIGFMRGLETRSEGRLTKLDFFDVLDESSDHLLLGACDTHLNSFLTLRLQDHQDGTIATISSRVHCKNRIGKLYMIPVGPIHAALVMWVLRKLQKRFQG